MFCVLDKHSRAVTSLSHFISTIGCSAEAQWEALFHFVLSLTQTDHVPVPGLSLSLSLSVSVSVSILPPPPLFLSSLSFYTKTDPYTHSNLCVCSSSTGITKHNISSETEEGMFRVFVRIPSEALLILFGLTHHSEIQ